MSDLRRIHLELTRRCPLECSKCLRTIQRGTYNASTDLPVSLLEQSLSNNFFNTIICSGNLGDPIYHPDLFDVIKLLQTKCNTLRIHTNGAGKTKEWWNTYYSLMRDSDKIVFGIDGLKDTNSMYRKNQDWESAFTGMKMGAKAGKSITWQWIPFSTNEHQISLASALAKRHGIEFILLKSHRWDNINDPLIPKDPDLFLPMWE
jgi:MoaA/NifB/PqqE/SkfB family radical SAM enzyme